ncbi:MAG: hypothetical protein PF444_07815, partial [Bacteroidales bacterium]|nr:hypothetical protein [Bacteroidales bacterium]
MIKYVQVFIWSFLLSTFSMVGQSQPLWMSYNINNDDGLSNSAVTSIFLDNEGFIWFGTWDGLNRYDGNQIKVYKPDVFREGTISNNIVREFIEDKDNNLWIVTDKGINRLNSDNLEFTSYLSESKDLPVKEHNLKTCLTSDSSILISLYGYGFAYYNAEIDSFLKLDLPQLSEQEEREIIGLYGKPDGIIFL